MARADNSISRRRLLSAVIATGAARVAADALRPRGVAAATLPRQAVGRPAPGATLRAVVPFGVTRLDPSAGSSGYSLLRFAMGETLLRVGVSGELEPWLAERVEPVDPTRWRVQLRQGIAFWNGRPLDAAAVKLSLERSVTRNPLAASLLPLAGVEVVGPHTLDLVLHTPDGGIDHALAHPFLVIHDVEAARQLGDDAFDQAPILSGPYQPVELRPGEYLRLQRHDRYWAGLPGLPAIEVRTVTDGNARTLAALADDTDLAQQIPIPAVAQVRAAGLLVQSTVPSDLLYNVIINTGRPPLDSPEVRQALSLAVDRRLLVERVLGGFGEAANGLCPSYLPFALPEPLPFDPAEARGRLDAAGWALGSDGVRQRDGRRLTFELKTYPQRPELNLLATALQAMWRELGVAVAIQQTEEITQFVNARADYDAAMWATHPAPTGDPAVHLTTAFHSRGSDTALLGGYANPRLDAVIDRLRAATNRAERAMLAQEAQRLLQQDLPTLPLVIPPLFVALAPRVAGFTLKRTQMYLLDERLSLT